MSWDLPEDGQKTISGLITDELDMIPTANICITLGSYKLETLGIEDNLIKEVKVSRVSEDPLILSKSNRLKHQRILSELFLNELLLLLIQTIFSFFQRWHLIQSIR